MADNVTEELLAYILLTQKVIANVGKMCLCYRCKILKKYFNSELYVENKDFILRNYCKNCYNNLNKSE